MNAAVGESRKPVQQDAGYYLPRWIAVFVAITLIPQGIMVPPTVKDIWYTPSLIFIGICEGTLGGLLFVGLQRWWNPRDSRVVRIRNYVAAGTSVGVGSLLATTAIYS